MKRKTIATSAGLIVVAACMVGCGTSAPVRYYGLVPVESQTTFEAPADFAISVGPVYVAEYLNRYQIVTRGDGVEMQFGEYDRWTEPLKESFQRTLTDNLAALLGSEQVLDFPAATSMSTGYLLPAQVTRFDTDATGNAVLEVQWLMKDLDEVVVVPGNRSRYTDRADDPDDYRSIVEALSRLIGAFSRDIAAAIEELP